MASMKGTEGQRQDLAARTWISQTTQQIQVLDYELQTTLRIIAAGETLHSTHKRAFMAATSRRARLMARVIRHVLSHGRSESIEGATYRVLDEGSIGGRHTRRLGSEGPTRDPV
jgi:hypothetical protein